jgi:hypothetical protein
VFRHRKKDNSLAVPPVAEENPAAVELLRVWAAPEAPQQLTWRTAWNDPEAWGLLPVDVARHAAKAYQAEGHNPTATLARIRELWDAECRARRTNRSTLLALPEIVCGGLRIKRCT